MTSWEMIRYLHVLAMAFFVGGQLILVAAVVPAFAAEPNRDRLRAIARRFAWGSLGALVVLLATGTAMAGHFNLWSDGTLQLKLALVALAGLLVVWHLRRPTQHWIEAAVLVVSLAIVWLGLALAH